jgi:hypothetical protein
MTSPDRSGCGRGPPRSVFLEPHQLRAQFANRNRQERIRDGGKGWGRAAAGSLVVASRGNRPYSSLFTSPTILRIADIHWTRQRTCLVRVKYVRMSPEPCFRHTDNVCRCVVRKRAALRMVRFPKPLSKGLNGTQATFHDWASLRGCSQKVTGARPTVNGCLSGCAARR